MKITIELRPMSETIEPGDVLLFLKRGSFDSQRILKTMKLYGPYFAWCYRSDVTKAIEEAQVAEESKAAKYLQDLEHQPDEIVNKPPRCKTINEFNSEFIKFKEKVKNEFLKEWEEYKKRFEEVLAKLETKQPTEDFQEPVCFKGSSVETTGKAYIDGVEAKPIDLDYGAVVPKSPWHPASELPKHDYNVFIKYEWNGTLYSGVGYYHDGNGWMICSIEDFGAPRPIPAGFIRSNVTRWMEIPE